MNDPYQVSGNERHVVRVFTSELEPEGAAAITAQNVGKLLGDDVTLDPSKVEVFPAKVIQPLGLSAYLAEGYGIADRDLGGTRAALDALTGLIVLVPSSAFGGRAAVLEPNPALRFIGAFSEPETAPPSDMASPDSATGRMTPPKARYETTDLRQKRGSWLIALGALIVAAALVLFAVF